MQYSVVHNGIPVGTVDLAAGDLVAGRLAPAAPLEPLRATIRAGSNALLVLGFFGAAPTAGQQDTPAALRAAAALRFDLLNEHGELAPTTFTNLIEAPSGSVVVLARFGYAHAPISALVPPPPRPVPEGVDPGMGTWNG